MLECNRYVEPESAVSRRYFGMDFSPAPTPFIVKIKSALSVVPTARQGGERQRTRTREVNFETSRLHL